MDDPRRPFCARTLLVSAAVLVTGLVACELVVRIFHWRPLPPPRESGSLLIEVGDPNLGFVHAPGGERALHYDDGRGTIRTVTTRTNRQRFRGPEVPREKAPDVLRVACLGDGQTFGRGVEEGDTWPDRLRERAVGAVEVLGCGVEGYDSLQTVLWYERYVEPFDPDVVLYAYSPDDVETRELAPEEAVPSDAWVQWTAPGRDDWVGGLRGGWRTLDLFLDRVHRERRLREMRSAWERQYADSFRGWRVTRNALVRLRDRCAGEGRELRVLLFPTLVLDGGAFLSRDALAEVAAFCERKRIPCFDGAPALLAAMESEDGSDLRVDPADLHAGPRAQEAFAAAVAGWLAGDGLPFGPRE